MFLYLIITLVVTLYIIVKKKYNYWDSRGVPHEKPTFPFGNYKNHILRRKHMCETAQEMCQKFENEKFIGAYLLTEPVFIPKDPEIIKLVATKDFCYFNGREYTKYSDHDPEALRLFGSHGNNWKILRQNMAPLFSSTKIKELFRFAKKSSHRFEKMLHTEIDVSKYHNIKALLVRFTIDCMTGFTFGLDSDVSKVNRATFRKDIVRIKQSMTLFAFYSRILLKTFPFFKYLLKFKRMSEHLDNFVNNMMMDVMQQRGYKPTGSCDFIDLVIKWKQNKVLVGDSIKNINGESHKVCLEINTDLLVANCGNMFAAGFDTSANVMSFILYELANHEEIQNKVLEEVDAYLSRHGNKLGFECLNEMPYLEACMYESMRLYPTSGNITREVMEDYILPGGVKLTKGVRVHIPVYYMHHNPKYFKDPEEFRPERFLGEVKKEIIPYTYMPFGEGPRICIGMRFAKLKMIVCIITLLKKYRLELPEDMPRTFKMKPDTITITPMEKIRIKFLERVGWQDRQFVRE